MRFSIFKGFFLVIAIIFSGFTNAQVLKHYSSEAELDHPPCYDTIRILGMFKTIQDVGRMLPTWVPVRGNDTVVVMEGKIATGNDKFEEGMGPHLGYVDLSLFHYTHDFCFNIVPDLAYQNLLCYQIFGAGESNPFELEAEEREKAEKRSDTVCQSSLHVEWETGLAAANKGNPCTAANMRGQSAGFSTSGHQRGDIIWNWPTAGDWVHVEGLWIWDRGHPPAEAEIHPMRFMGTKRGLISKITVDGSAKFATRVDIYASGDGGAFNNNRPNQPGFVHPVKMATKNYSFTVSNSLPRPSANAALKYQIITKKGNTYTGDVVCTLANDSSYTISIPWKDNNIADTAVLATTVYLYWDEGIGTSQGVVSEIKISVKKLKILHTRDFLNRGEFRVFMDIGGNWMFLNELYGTANNILTRGMGKTSKRNFNINKDFTVYVLKQDSFRVYVTGWEADGIEGSFGHLVNPHSVCDPAVKKIINKEIVSISKVAMHGCLDDNFGEGYNYHKAQTNNTPTSQIVLPNKGRNEDLCPCAKYRLEKSFKLFYTIEKVN